MQDTMLSLWDTIPPEKPKSLSAYAGRIARNKAVDRYRFIHSQKREENISHGLKIKSTTVRAVLHRIRARLKEYGGFQ